MSTGAGLRPVLTTFGVVSGVTNEWNSRLCSDVRREGVLVLEIVKDDAYCVMVEVAQHWRG